MKFDWGHLAVIRRGKRAALLNSTAAHRLETFRREEDGAGSMMSLYVTVMLLMLAGLGIDTMRQEMERTHLQATLDSAVLAGAGAPTGSDKEDVKDIVEDYFAKHQMSSYLQEIDIDGEGQDDIEISLNATRVFAEANMDIDTYLLQMTGVDQLRALGEAEAQVARPKLEISLVLDVSGSMDGVKLTNLQTAANSFVTTMLTQSDPGDVFISLVPFAWTVTPSSEIFNQLTVNVTHDYSNCLRFSQSDYDTPEIDPGETQDLQIFTSVYGDFDDFNSDWRSCYADQNTEVLAYSTSEADLHAHINGLTAAGNTSAHIGMKWGAALLDPEFDTVVTGLQSVSAVDASLSNIPAQYNEPETLKVVVLMADGQNTYSYYFDDNSPYRGPNSDLYRLTWQEMEFDYAWRERNRGGIRYSNDESKCSNSKWNCEYIATGDQFSAYYLYDDEQYLDIEGTGPISPEAFDAEDSPDEVSTGTPNGGSPTWIDDDVFDDFQEQPAYVSTQRLSWEDAWGLMTPNWYGHTTGNWNPWNDYVGSQFESGSTKDTRMQSICTATKNKQVIVYTIGYDITEDGNAEVQLETCASSLNHYYPTDGNNISDAFSSIASNVKNLRLTQ